MLNKQDEKKIICGSIIGGIVAIGALTIYCASKKKCKNSSLSLINSTLNTLVEKLEECKEDASCAVHDMEDKIKKNENVITDVFELASIGINLWKRFKKG
jgi:hypothetical protein